MILLALTAALAGAPEPAKVIVVTATEGYRHESIETAEEVISSIAQTTGWFVPQFVRTAAELPAALTAESLASAKIVMFVNTTGELGWPQRQLLLDWVSGGGSFIGVHSAADTWHEWAPFLEMLGGEFESHPDEMAAAVVVVDPRHPATAGLATPHSLFEEYYRFRNFSRDRVNLLMTLGDGSPVAWFRFHGSGRVFYTALGHRDDVWTSAWFRQHLTGAMLWAAGQELVPRRRAVGRPY